MEPIESTNVKRERSAKIRERQLMSTTEGKDLTSHPNREEQTDLVFPRQEIDEQDTQQIRDKIKSPNICSAVLQTRSHFHTAPDRHNLNNAVDTPQKCCLQRGKSEGVDDNLALVQEGVRDVVECREQSKEPGLWVQKRFDHLLPFEMLVLDSGLIFLSGNSSASMGLGSCYTITFILRTAIVRSAGVRNQAVVGESGKKSLYELTTISLKAARVLPIGHSRHECQCTRDDHKPEKDSVQHEVYKIGRHTIAMVQSLLS